MAETNAPEETARIEIVLLADGQLQVAMNVPSRYVFNAMMETAKQNLLGQIAQTEMRQMQEAQSRRVMAGVVLPGNLKLGR